MCTEPEENTPLLRVVTRLPDLQEDNMKLCVKSETCRRLSERKIVVDILAILFGIGAWIAVNGLYVQLPLLVETQPEGWNLPSYISIIVQIANVGPILYGISQKFLPGKIRDSIVIYAILLVGTFALLLIAFLYQRTTYIAGQERSTALFVLSFFISLVGCTSSVLFMPFMRNYKEMYLISYFVGEGLSGFLPSIVALIQGVGGNTVCVNQTITNTNGSSYVTQTEYTPPPNFSTTSFLFFLFGMLSISTVSFALLNNLRICKEEKVSSHKNISPQNHSDISPTMEILKDSSLIDGLLSQPRRSKEGIQRLSYPSDLNDDGVYTVTSAPDVLQKSTLETERIPLSRCTYIYLLLLVSWVCLFGNGVFPSIQSYSCLPYGNNAYHLAATLSSMANPLACFLGFFLPYSSVKAISFLTVFSTAFAAYIAVTAVMSPVPPLVGYVSGEFLVVISWVLFTGGISYIKLSVASLLRKEEGRALFWCGAVQQMGSAVGSVAIFFLVNYTNIFQSYSVCQ